VFKIVVKCVPGKPIYIAWGIRSAVCANEFLDDYVSYVSLSFVSV